MCVFCHSAFDNGVLLDRLLGCDAVKLQQRVQFRVGMMQTRVADCVSVPTSLGEQDCMSVCGVCVCVSL